STSAARITSPSGPVPFAEITTGVNRERSISFNTSRRCRCVPPLTNSGEKNAIGRGALSGENDTSAAHIAFEDDRQDDQDVRDRVQPHVSEEAIEQEENQTGVKGRSDPAEIGRCCGRPLQPTNITQ